MKEAGRSIFFTLFLALLVICFTPAFATSDGDEDIFTQDYMRLSGLADQGAVASQVVDWDGEPAMRIYRICRSAPTERASG